VASSRRRALRWSRGKWRSAVLRSASSHSSLPIREPSIEQVLVDQTTRLRDEYVACVADSLTRCNLTLTDAVDGELQRAASARAHNRRLVEDAEGLYRRCRAARIRGEAAVAQWRAASPLPSSPYALSCSAAEQAGLQAAQGDVDAELAAVHAVNDEYANKSQGTVALLVGQIEARGRYDREYLHNKTLAHVRLRQLRLSLTANFSADLSLRLGSLNLSLLLACATLSPSHRCPGESLRDMVSASQQRLYSSYTGAVRAWGDSVGRVENYADAAQDRLASAANALAAIAAWFGRNFPEFQGSLPGGVPWPSLGLGAFGLDIGDIAPIAPPLSIDEMWQRVSEVVARYEENLALATSEVNADGSLLQADA